MSGPSSYEPKTAIERWLDTRLPIIRFSADLLPIAPSDLAPIVNYTQIRVAGVILRVGMHVIEQPATMQLSGQTLWEKTTVPACQPWFFVGLPQSWTATPNTAGAMFP